MQHWNTKCFFLTSITFLDVCILRILQHNNAIFPVSSSCGFALLRVLSILHFAPILFGCWQMKMMRYFRRRVVPSIVFEIGNSSVQDL